MFKQFTVIGIDEQDYDFEQVITLPVKYEVCSRCNGAGTIVNPNIDGNGICSEKFDEDPDFREAYFSGVYDIPCPCCDGERVEAVVDEERADPALLKLYKDDKQAKYEADRENYLTHRGECPWEYL